MKDSSSSSIRLGGAVISDRIVSALLEELRTGRYATQTVCPQRSIWLHSSASAARSSAML